MKILFKTLAVAALLAGASSAAVAAPAKPAAAPAAGAQAGVNGIGIANLDAVLYNSVAFKKAQVDRETTYKAQFDAAKAREAEIGAQTQAIVDKFQKDKPAPGANVAALQQTAQTQVNKLQEDAKAQIGKIIEPVRLSDAYVAEQITDKRAQAVVAAMQKNNVGLLLSPEAVINVTNQAYNLSPAILAELNAALPSVQIVPPAGWLPREVREQQAQQQAAQGGAQQPATAESR